MNYTDITLAARAYADRQDIEVENNLDLFIIMVEARINRLLKTREQSARVYLDAVVDQEYYCLPVDYAGLRDIQVNSDLPTNDHTSYPVDQMTPIKFNKQRNQTFNGRYYYSIIADQLQIFPTLADGCTIELVYYQKVPNLTATAITNWLSISHPDAYIAGMTAEVEIFAKNYEAGQLWYKRVSSIINELEDSDKIERWSGAPLQMRVDHG